MTKQNEGEGKKGGKSGGKGSGCILGAIQGFLIVIVVALVSVFFAIRTDYFRKWLARNIEERTGLVMTMSDTGVGWPYCLVVKNLKSVVDQRGIPALLSVDEARLEPCADLRSAISLKGCSLTMVKTKNGAWEPNYFARLGDLRSFQQVGPLTEAFRDRMRISITRGEILWVDSENKRLASVGNFDFSMEPLVTGTGKKLYYCNFSARDVVLEDGEEKRNVKVEWVVTEDSRYAEIVREEKEGFAAPGPKPKTGNGVVGRGLE